MITLRVEEIHQDFDRSWAIGRRISTDISVCRSVAGGNLSLIRRDQNTAKSGSMVGLLTRMKTASHDVTARAS
jgi:hypothetical protein